MPHRAYGPRLACFIYTLSSVGPEVVALVNFPCGCAPTHSGGTTSPDQLAMVLLVRCSLRLYAFYHKHVFSTTIYHHTHRETRCLQHSGAQQSHLQTPWHGCEQPAAQRRVRIAPAKQPLVCTASLHQTPPFQAAKSKAFLVLSDRGAAVALVALRRDLDPSHLRTPHTLMLGRRPPHAQGPCACGAVLGFVRRPPCGERQGSRIISARASKGVKRDRTGCPPNLVPDANQRATIAHQWLVGTCR